eukprot:590130-Hanusia_phi.AAC.1
MASKETTEMDDRTFQLLTGRKFWRSPHDSNAMIRSRHFRPIASRLPPAADLPLTLPSWGRLDDCGGYGSVCFPFFQVDRVLV